MTPSKTNLKTVVTALLLGLSAQLACAQQPVSDPTNQGGWVLNRSISDEFEGNQLDTKKWFVQGTNGQYQNRFKGRAPSQFAPANVSLADGKLVITSKWQPDFDFADETFAGSKYEKVTSGAIISKANFLYGYLETKCKAADGPISSSFWTTGEGGELDVFEHYGNNPRSVDTQRKYQSSFHDWRIPGTPTYGQRIWTNEHQLPFRVADDYHVYGLEWNENFIKIYVDGILVRCATKSEIGDSWVVNKTQKVWFDSETFPWEVKPEKLKPEDFPNGGRKFLVDYVRIWKRTGTESGCQPTTNLISNHNFENKFDSWQVSGNATLVADRSQSYSGSNHVSVAKGGDGAIEQTVKVKPNTTYILSAWGKSPGTNNTTIFDDGWIGVKNYGGGFQTVNFFKNHWHRKSLQFKTGATATTATVLFTNQWSDEPSLIDNFELVEAMMPLQNKSSTGK